MRLLERDELLSALAEQQRQAAEGIGRMVVVEGEAGIGKTSLLRVFAARQPGSVAVHWGACDALQTPRPLAPLQDIAEHSRGELLSLLEGDAARLRIFGEFLRMLSARHVVVTVEDLHWADEATLDLLRYVGRRIASTKALLVTSCRSDELGPTHPLRLVLGDLATSGLQRLALPPLSLAAVRELAGPRGRDPDDLHRKTGGNPFFVTEALAAEGNGVPVTVRDAVLARAARLRPSARAILDAAAVAGPRVEPWLLQDLVAAEAEAVAECLATGVLHAQGDVFMFRHELARQSVLEAMTPTRRVSLHRLVLQALQSRHTPVRDLARLAHHAEAAGEEAAVLQYAPAAARDAAAKGAHRQAAQQWARALRQAVEDPAERATFLEAYAWEAQLTGWMDDSLDARRKAVALWREIRDRDREAVSLSLLAVDLVVAGRNPEGETMMCEALSLVEPGGETPAVAIAHRCSAYLRMLDRDPEVAIRQAGLAMVIADRLGDQETGIFCRNAIGSSMIIMGRIEEGIRHLESSLELAEQCSFDTGVASALGNLGSACGEMYRLDLAESYLLRGIRYCVERDLDRWRYYQLAWLALVQMYRGRWEESAASAHSVLAVRGSSATARMMALIALGRVRARRGDPGVWEALDEARELAGYSGTLQRVAPMLAARAEAAWLDGRADEFATPLDDGLELALRKRHAWFTCELLYWRSRAEDAPAGSVPEFCGDNPFGLELRGQWREAADAWRSLGCPYETARALGSGDEAARREALGILESLAARPLADRLRQELRAAGVRGLKRGPRETTRQHPAGLTSKELRVLMLLSEGLRNKDIAGRLNRSVRTIDHHVAAIFAKLGAANRAEAVRAAHRRGLLDDGQLPSAGGARQ